MESKKIDILSNDFDYVRKTLSRYQEIKKGSIEELAYKVHMYLIVVSLILCGGLYVFELVSDNYFYRYLVETNQTNKAQNIIALAIFLLVAVIHHYLVVFIASKQVNEKVHNYIKRNFNYLSSASHIYDLFLKFMIVVGLVYAEKLEWLGIALILFVVDYLFQKRLFVISKKNRIICMVFSLVLLANSFYAYSQGISKGIIAPCLIFIICGIVSIETLRKMKRIEG